MKLSKYLKIGFTLILAGILVACGNGGNESETDEETEVSIGVVGDVSREIWEDVATRLEDDGIHLEVVTFSDYVQPNRAVEEGELDMNAFQHMAFLTEYVNDTGDDLVPMGYTIISPMYIFATEDIPDVESIPDGAKVAVSNSATNAERAYLGLEAIGLIELADNAGFAPTIDDVKETYKNIEILELDPSQLARALGDADLITLGGDMVADAGMNLEDAIYIDTDHIDTIDPLKKNIIAAKEANADSEVLQKIVAEYQSEETAALIAEISQGSSIPIWEDTDTSREDFEKAMADRQ